ncbi:MAG: alpha/beta fold hydrolase [Gammaproteobacteria bacterium]|nr:alpha/beta fold hydrolase [Gammaproteobacteria bacterium]
MFGNERASLRYGTADVSIPRDHRLGELEEPSILRLEFKEDPDQHVVLMHVVVQDADAFFRGVKSKVAESGKRSAFIFVHGYHVSFEDATRRTAQMAYDLGFEGAPVLYSWPSQGTLAGYTIDESNAEWTQRNLEDFLLDFAERSGADDIHLISHSMGGRPLTRAVVALMQRHPELKRHFSELILTAPDIDAQVFARDIVPGLLQTGAPITLYASSEDNALAASKQVHGYPRAGDSGRGLVVMSGVETVDATGMDTGFLKHSYYAETRSVLSDMFYLIHNGERADQRFGLRGIDSPAGRYWVFKK